MPTSALSPVPQAVALSGPARLAQDTASYLRDTFQRTVLTLDVLRERGDIFIAHYLAGKPPLLKF